MSEERDRASCPDDPVLKTIGSTDFRTRGQTNMRSEMALDVLAQNIRRMVARLGTGGLMRAMQG